MRRAIHWLIRGLAPLAILAAPPAPAATLLVSPGEVAVAANGLCSLIEAIENAQADAAVHADCPAGDGPDLIQLPGGVDYVLTTPQVPGSGGAPATGLPEITTVLAIRGNQAVIRRSDAPGTPPFRLLATLEADLLLDGISLRGGRIGPHPLLGGAAVYQRGGRLVAEHVRFEDNAITGPGRGGALLVDGSAALPRTQTILRDCRFADNAVQADAGTSTLGGGAISVDAGTLSVERCAFVDNRAGPLQAGPTSAGGVGGALHATGILAAPGIDDTEVFIGHSTFSGNVARQGGAIAVTVPTAGVSVLVALDYATVTGNRAVGGTGAGLWGSGTGLVQFAYGSSVVHGNGTTAAARDCLAASAGVGFQSLGRNLLDPDDLCPFDDELDILDANLGLHLDPDRIDDAHAPRVGGALVNASGLGCVPGVTRDQQRRLRANGPGQGGNACEIGAIELHGDDGSDRIFADGFQP